MELSPQYVLYNEEYVNISTFADIPPKDRPKVYCPQCKEPVILKLGKIKEHHFSHLPDSDCAWSRESIEHFNAKVKVYDFLRQYNELSRFRLCKNCNNKWESHLNSIYGWDEVKMEFNFNNFRADIALIRNHSLLMVIEIVVTHWSSVEKITYLQFAGIEYFEIQTPLAIKVRNNCLYFDVQKNSYFFNWLNTDDYICDHCKNTPKQPSKKTNRSKNLNTNDFYQQVFPNFGQETFEYWEKNLERLNISREQLEQIHFAPAMVKRRNKIVSSGLI